MHSPLWDAEAESRIAGLSNFLPTSDRVAAEGFLGNSEVESDNAGVSASDGSFSDLFPFSVDKTKHYVRLRATEVGGDGHVGEPNILQPTCDITHELWHLGSADCCRFTYCETKEPVVLELWGFLGKQVHNSVDVAPLEGLEEANRRSSGRERVAARGCNGVVLGYRVACGQSQCKEREANGEPPRWAPSGPQNEKVHITATPTTNRSPEDTVDVYRNAVNARSPGFVS